MFVLNKFSQIANIEPKLTTIGLINLELSCVSKYMRAPNLHKTMQLLIISHEERLLPLCFSVNDFVIKGSVLNAAADVKFDKRL